MRTIHLKSVHLKSAVAAVALFAAVGTASALVTFDPENGEGFVGKGDVQLAFGWNNSALQENANGVTFQYAAIDEYEAVCEFTTGPAHSRTTHTITETELTSVAGAPDGDPRKVKGQQQFTGFDLEGFEEDPVIIGDLPIEGDQCKPAASQQPSEWLSVELVSSTGQLKACHNSICVVIWSTPL